MRIGPYEFEKALCLAPMEDVSDIPFRLLCREQGADLVYTEFANCEALIRNVKDAHRKIEVHPAERPVAVQIYGSMESSMERAAEIAALAGPDFIDINCGCWVKKIALRGDGAGLLRDLAKFRSVVESVQRGTALPVTVKTRLGWDWDNVVILDVARMLEDLGVQALTVHCRTRSMGYTGQADWSWLARIREVSAIPLIANGDIDSPRAAETCFNYGCDGVMIGRGAIHSPWIFRHIKHYLVTGEELPEPPLTERIAMCIRHLGDMAAYRGERVAVPCFRRHYAGYLRNAPNIALLRKDLMQLTAHEAVVERLQRYAAELDQPTLAA